MTELEALSVIVAIQKSRPYLLGNHFTVVVDHQALKWLISLCDPTGRLARWAMTLQRYDLTIQYRPGKDPGNADALLRRVYTISQQPMLPQTLTEELTIKSVMTNSNLLSDTYRIGLYPRTPGRLRKSCAKRASISSVIITLYIDNHTQGKELSFSWWCVKPYKRSSYIGAMATSLVTTLG